MAAVNLTVRFVLELAGIAALAYAGYQIPEHPVLRWVLMVVLPVALIVVWALVVAPSTDNGLDPRIKDAIGTAVLLVAAGVLALAGRGLLAAVFAAIVLANGALLYLLGGAAEHGHGAGGSGRTTDRKR